MISNLLIVKEILDEKILDHKFNIVELIKLSRKDNLDKYYIGQKYKTYHRPGLITEKDSYLLSGIFSKSETTLFKHDEDDFYYFDILDDNKHYEKIYEDVFSLTNGCSELESLEELVKEKKKGIK